MGLKLLGGVLLLASGLALGFHKAHTLQLRVRQLRFLGLALRVLENEVGVGATPLPEALRRAARVAEADTGGLLEEAAGRLVDGRGLTAQQAWSEALAECSPRLALNGSDVEVLGGLGVTLGASGRSDQTRHIALVRERLTAQEEVAREEAEKQGRLYRYLGVLVPVGILLILW
ncbi:MAG TPA: stage III sporulation protein AB [Firmicutes bacterium]|nr:stage III sporulation protein AB [Bacillota bacterium]